MQSKSISQDYLKKIYLPAKDSHKGQNGRLLIIGGSHLFHSASLWALKVASCIVDLVHYSSVEENNKIVQKLKEEFRDGIIVSRLNIEDYIREDDCILIGPGMVRTEYQKHKSNIKNIRDIENIEDEGIQTYYLTKYLLQKYPNKKWVIDAGALQMMEVEWIPKAAILTPHKGEFERLLSKIPNSKFQIPNINKTKDTSDGDRRLRHRLEELVKRFAKQFHCTILLKGETDFVAFEDKFEEIKGGNAGMTKGGTGDVLAGLVAALYCKNDAFSSAVAASYINKKAGDDLYKEKGYWFNASDLANQIPRTMKELLL